MRKLEIMWFPMNIGWLITQEASLNMLSCEFSYQHLRDTKNFVDTWFATNPDGVVIVRRREERVEVSNDDDWVIALLKFGP